MHSRRFLIIFFFLQISCRGIYKERDPLLDEYRNICRQYDSAIATLQAKLLLNNTPSHREQFQAQLNQNIRNEMQALSTSLSRWKDSSRDHFRKRLIRARILIELHRFPEAEKLMIDLSRKFPGSIDLKKEKLRLLMNQNKALEAGSLFQEIEKDLQDPVLLSDILLFLSHQHPDQQKQKYFARKFLQKRKHPPTIEPYRPAVSRLLSQILLQEGDMEGSRRVLTEISPAKIPPLYSLLLECERNKLQFLSQPALKPSGEKWLNTSPPFMSKIRGNRYLICFWAHWNQESREFFIRTLREIGDKTPLIGATRLYGFTDISSTTPVSPQWEIQWIQTQLQKDGITSPIMISPDGGVMDRYGIHVFPALIQVDENERVTAIEFGVENANRLIRRLKI